jgi:NADH dehydrogenase
LTGVTVETVDADGVTYQGNAGTVERLSAKTVLWAGGVNVGAFGRVLASRTGVPTGSGGRLKVGPDLTIPGYPEIYVLGDLAEFPAPDGKPLPGVAQVAMQGGAYAAKAIVARLNAAEQPESRPPFRFRDKGDIAVIGRAAAVARIFGLRLHGLVAWLVWLFIHLMYLVQFQNRVVVFVQWGFQYLTFSRGARLITGQAASDSVTPGPTMKNINPE